jgi:peroxiredoxin
MTKWRSAVRIDKLALGALLITVALGSNAAMAAGRLELGGAAPRLKGPDLSGNSVSLGDFVGKWVYVDFWASWCVPCIKSLPEVVALNRSSMGRGDLVVLGVSLDDSSTGEAMRKAVGKNGITYPVLYDGSGWQSAVAGDWGVTAIPSTFLIDPQGKIAARDLPPSMVEAYIDRGRGKGGGSATAKFEPAGKTPRLPALKVSSAEQLLEDSPSSGDPRLRDLHISMTVDGSNPEQKYRVSFFMDRGSGKKSAFAWRYEVRLLPMPGNSQKPFYLDIKPAPGKLDLRSLAAGGGKKLPSKVDEDSMPLISATFDSRQKKYDLVVPVPQDVQSLSYSLAFFDPVVGQYIGNGLVSVL